MPAKLSVKTRTSHFHTKSAPACVDSRQLDHRAATHRLQMRLRSLLSRSVLQPKLPSKKIHNIFIFPCDSFLRLPLTPSWPPQGTLFHLASPAAPLGPRSGPRAPPGAALRPLVPKLASAAFLVGFFGLQLKKRSMWGVGGLGWRIRAFVDVRPGCSRLRPSVSSEPSSASGHTKIFKTLQRR